MNRPDVLRRTNNVVIAFLTEDHDVVRIPLLNLDSDDEARLSAWLAEVARWRAPAEAGVLEIPCGVEPDTDYVRFERDDNDPKDPGIWVEVREARAFPNENDVNVIFVPRARCAEVAAFFGKER